MVVHTRNIILLYNTFSGNGKGIDIAHTIKIQLAKLSIPHVAYENTWPEGFNLGVEIWIIGGDGTLNYFVNKYGIIPNKIALFAGGTGNDFHWHLYKNMSLDDQIRFALTAIAKPIDVGKCNEKYFINMVGLGFDGAVLKGINSFKWIGGHLAYLIAVIKNIFSYKETNLTIELHGKTIQLSLLLCIISNAPRTGGGFMVSPNAVSNDGLFNWVRCGPMSILDRLLFLPKVEKGSHLSHSKVFEEKITNINITSQNPTFYQLDGELMCSDSFSITIIKGALNFLH